MLFSEATVHGALPWTLEGAENQRRVALYRFAPATSAYGRSYMACVAVEENQHEQEVDEEKQEQDTGVVEKIEKRKTDSDEKTEVENTASCTWPAGMYADECLTDAQRAVLQPPFAVRLNREVLNLKASEECDVEVVSRSGPKKAFDRQVFGTEYF